MTAYQYATSYNITEMALGDYREICDIKCILVGDKIVDHSDVVGASPVDAVSTTASISTERQASMDWAKTTSRWDNKHFSFGIWCILY